MELSVCWAVKEIPLSRKKEALLLKGLTHPSIPRMIDMAQTKEACFLVMEYIQGQSLEEYIKEGKTLSQSQLLELALTITDIFVYLHGQTPPILYGDLKPSNLMLSQSGKLYLVDMGSAIALWSNQVPMALEGTRGFASPEQYQGRIYPQSDLYCLGKTLLALGRGHLSPGLKHFAAVCTREDLLKRYCSAKQAREALLKLQRRRRLLLPLWGSLTGGILFSGVMFGLLGLFPGRLPLLPSKRPPAPITLSPTLPPSLSSSLPSSLILSATPTPRPSSTLAPTSVPTFTPTPTPTLAPTNTNAPSPAPTSTPVPTSTPTPTSTPMPTSTLPPQKTQSIEELLEGCLEEAIWNQADESSLPGEGEGFLLSLEEEKAQKVKKELLGLLARSQTLEEKLHCLSLLASFTQLSGEPQEAVSFYEQMLSLQEDECIRASLGLLYLRLGKEKESLELYEEARAPSHTLPCHEQRLWEEKLFQERNH